MTETVKRGVKPGTKRGKYRSRRRRLGGERPLYKLSREDAEAIWKLLQQKFYTQEEIASMFGVTQEAVSHIATGARWNVVTGLPRRNKYSTGLPPSKQTRGRPRGVYIKKLKKASSKHYKAMEDACILALLRGAKKVRIRLPRVFKKPPDFPPFFDRVVEGNVHICNIPAAALLNWLHKHSYSKYCSSDVQSVNSQVKLQIEFAELDVALDIFKDAQEDLGL